jgi:hypothetical protein
VLFGRCLCIGLIARTDECGVCECDREVSTDDVCIFKHYGFYFENIRNKTTFGLTVQKKFGKRGLSVVMFAGYSRR